MIAVAIVLVTLVACGLFLLGSLYLSRVPFWKRLAKKNPLDRSPPNTYGFPDVAAVIYDDSIGYGIKARIRLAVEGKCLFVAFEPVGLGWQDRLPALQLGLDSISSEGSELRSCDLRIVLRSGGTIVRWNEVLRVGLAEPNHRVVAGH